MSLFNNIFASIGWKRLFKIAQPLISVISMIISVSTYYAKHLDFLSVHEKNEMYFIEYYPYPLMTEGKFIIRNGTSTSNLNNKICTLFESRDDFKKLLQNNYLYGYPQARLLYFMAFAVVFCLDASNFFMQIDKTLTDGKKSMIKFGKVGAKFIFAPGFLFYQIIDISKPCVKINSLSRGLIEWYEIMNNITTLSALYSLILAFGIFLYNKCTCFETMVDGCKCFEYIITWMALTIFFFIIYCILVYFALFVAPALTVFLEVFMSVNIALDVVIQYSSE